MTDVLTNTSIIVDHLSNLTATVSIWIERLEGIGNVPTRQAKLQQLVNPPLHTSASPPQTRPVKTLRQIGVHNVSSLEVDCCTVKASSFSTSQKEDCGPAVVPSSALADLRPSQTTSPTGQFLTAPPPTSPPMVTPRQSSFNHQNPRKRKAGLVIKACSTPDLRSEFVEVYFDGATLKTLEDLVKDLTKFAGGIYRHLRNANVPPRMNVLALEIDDKDEGCEHDDVGGEKVDLSVLKLQFVSTRRMRPSYDQTASLASQPSTFGNLKKALADCEDKCDKAAQSLLKYGDCISEIGDIRSKLEELKKVAQKEIEMFSVK